KVDGAATARALPGPLLFQPGTTPLQLKHVYRGSMQIDVVNGKLRAINFVGLEQYLYGVVPSEMPYTWAPEALKAQAVVARSYALATRRSGAFDLYPDTRSQVYLGVERTHSIRRGRLGVAGPVPRLRPGSLRLDLAAPHLGAGRLHRRRPREA